MTEKLCSFLPIECSEMGAHRLSRGEWVWTHYRYVGWLGEYDYGWVWCWPEIRAMKEALNRRIKND